jgi:hypothetical protein
MDSGLDRRALLVGGGLVIAAVTTAPPAAAASAVTKSAKRAYYASDVGIFPNAVMPIDSIDALGRKYAAGKSGRPNVQAVGSPGLPAVDQSDEINAFLQDVRAKGGGIAIFEGNAQQLVGYGIGKPIIMLPEVAIWGLGWNKTTFMLLDGANCSAFVNQPGGNLFDLRDLRINGNRWGEDFGAVSYTGAGVGIADPKHPANPNNWQFNSHGILMVPDFKNPNNTGYYGDTYAHFENIFVIQPYGSAVMTNKIGGEIRFRNIFSSGAGGNGFQAGYDSFLTDVTVGNSEFHGFYQQNGSTRFVNTKAFWCGQLAERWQIGGGGLKVRRASAGYKVINGTCEFSSSEAQNCGAEGMWLQGESVNGQFAAIANNMLADMSALSNPDGWGPLPDNFANDVVWGGAASAPKVGPGSYPGVRLVGKSKYNNLVIVSRTAGQQAGGGLGQQAYALAIDAVGGSVENNISVTHSDGYDGTRVRGIVTPETPHAAVTNNWIVANGKPLSDIVRAAPADLYAIDAAGTYMASGQGYQNNPFPGGAVRISCTEWNGALFLEAVRVDSPGAPYTNIKWPGGNWGGWIQRNRSIAQPAPVDLLTIKSSGIYLANGQVHQNNPFPGGSVVISCLEINGSLFMEAERIDAAGAPYTNIKWSGGNWSGWTLRSRA